MARMSLEEMRKLLWLPCAVAPGREFTVDGQMVVTGAQKTAMRMNVDLWSCVDVRKMDGRPMYDAGNIMVYGHECTRTKV